MTAQEKRRQEGDPQARKIEADANGQFVQSKRGRHNSGVSSAKPRVITGRDDATSVSGPEGGERDSGSDDEH